MHTAMVTMDMKYWVRTGMQNPNAWKGRIWHLFEHCNLPNNSGGYLFRVDLTPSRNPQIFIVSRNRPDPDGLRGEEIMVKVGKVDTGAFQTGNKFHFKSRVNATMDDKNGRDVERPEADIPRWMSWKLAGGAKVECAVVGQGKQKARRVGHQSITHYYYDIKGILEIEDGAVFTDTMATGIGRGKRFGMGLVCPFALV